MPFLANTDLSPNLIERAKRATKSYIDLTSSNPTEQGLLFPPDVLRDAAADYWHTRHYAPDARGNAQARAAIANYYATRNTQHDLDIFITASTSEAYSLLFALLCAPGDNVLAPDVGYPLFDFLADVHHIELRPYKLNEQNNWQIDEQSLRDAADDKTKAVLIISPHNPTGAVVQSPIASLQSLNLPIICDEVFAEFTYAVSDTPLLSDLHPTLPVFTLNGISKMFALPDLKLGWVALNPAAAQHYAARLEILNDTFLSANYLTQHMLPALFEHGWHFVQHQRNHVRKNLDMAIGMFDGCSAIQLNKPDGGYNLFCRVLGWRNEDALVLHLLRHGVLVHPGYFFNDEHGCHIFISCLTETKQLREGLRRVVAAL